MKGIEREKYALQLHARLLQRDPVAPSEFVEAFLDELVRRLRAKVDPHYEKTLFLDAATDALLDYVQHPSKFDPHKSALLTYLTMAAYRDFLNILAKQKRRRRHEVPLQAVEETLNRGNNMVEAENGALNHMKLKNNTEILRMVAEIFPDTRDRELLKLMMNGERKTVVFSDVLGIQSLPLDEQRKIVKQHKDRITKRLQRLGGRIREK